jgi:hypothetical protein
MTSHESPGLVRRLLRALGGALQRGILGKSADAYMKQFTGSDEYWDRVIAAQLGWPQQQCPKADPVRSRSPGDAMVRARPGVRDNVPRPQEEPGFEPVHGWSRRQFDGYLARNPGYRSTYEAELQKHQQAYPYRSLTVRQL